MTQTATRVGRWSATGGLKSITFGPDQPLQLASGESLSPLTIAYETYGALNADKTNAVLVCHALTGDQFVAAPNPVTGNKAWWPRIVGPGKPVATHRRSLICAHVRG